MRPELEFCRVWGKKCLSPEIQEKRRELGKEKEKSDVPSNKPEAPGDEDVPPKELSKNLTRSGATKDEKN